MMAYDVIQTNIIKVSHTGFCSYICSLCALKDYCLAEKTQVNRVIAGRIVFPYALRMRAAKKYILEHHEDFLEALL